jgi:hypothetical protein
MVKIMTFFKVTPCTSVDILHIKVLEESAAHHLKPGKSSSPEMSDVMHQATWRHNIQNKNILNPATV